MTVGKAVLQTNITCPAYNSDIIINELASSAVVFPALNCMCNEKFKDDLNQTERTFLSTVGDKYAEHYHVCPAWIKHPFLRSPFPLPQNNVVNCLSYGSSRIILGFSTNGILHMKFWLTPRIKWIPGSMVSTMPSSRTRVVLSEQRPGSLILSVPCKKTFEQLFFDPGSL